MNPVDIIVKKRDGGELSRAELRFFVEGLSRGTIPDYQVAAWAMAIYFQGMTPAETSELTLAMAESGDLLDQHADLPPGTRIVDKHSSGGVGDKTSLVVGPIVAACGLPVGKMSGRGLSYSGGTIDKLESIAGWSSELDSVGFRRQLQEVGLVIAGQSANLAPADKQLYALRDVTGTVPSLPLIASSIMSKKLAAGADGVVLDVKCGRGAFMATPAEAEALARLMVVIGVRAGRRVTALISQMDQPLGHAVGNALEVREAIEALQGGGPADLAELARTVAGEMLMLGSAGAEREVALQDALARVDEVIASGAALARFRQMVAAQGGDPFQVDEPERLPRAPLVLDLQAAVAGWIGRIDAREVGLTVVELGGGRRRKEEAVDHRVGVVIPIKVGDRVAAGARLAQVHAATESAAQTALQRLQKALQIQGEPVAPLPLILGRIDGDAF